MRIKFYDQYDQWTYGGPFYIRNMRNQNHISMGIYIIDALITYIEQFIQSFIDWYISS
nr:MAG TPA: hypothetical protein [Caudoviricetes sp.]